MMIKDDKIWKTEDTFARKVLIIIRKKKRRKKGRNARRGAIVIYKEKENDSISR